MNARFILFTLLIIILFAVMLIPAGAQEPAVSTPTPPPEDWGQRALPTATPTEAIPYPVPYPAAYPEPNQQPGIAWQDFAVYLPMVRR